MGKGITKAPTLNAVHQATYKRSDNDHHEIKNLVLEVKRTVEKIGWSLDSRYEVEDNVARASQVEYFEQSFDAFKSDATEKLNRIEELGKEIENALIFDAKSSADKTESQPSQCTQQPPPPAALASEQYQETLELLGDIIKPSEYMTRTSLIPYVERLENDLARLSTKVIPVWKKSIAELPIMLDIYQAQAEELEVAHLDETIELKAEIQKLQADRLAAAEKIADQNEEIGMRCDDLKLAVREKENAERKVAESEARLTEMDRVSKSQLARLDALGRRLSPFPEFTATANASIFDGFESLVRGLREQIRVLTDELERTKKEAESPTMT